MRRFYIVLNEHTLHQLAEVAERERRDPRQQAAYILERVLAQATQKSVQQTTNETELARA